MNPNPNSNPYETMLKESINRFFAERRRGVTNFSDFTSIFSRMLHAAPNPPIPVLWFYAALEFHAARDPSRSARDLFQLLVSCSGSCGSTKRIAALAPLVFVLHRMALRRGEFRSEVEELVEGVVNYCSIFCGKEVCDGDVAVVEFEDLIKVWMVDGGGGGGGVFGDCGVEGFFPLVSEEFRKGIVRGCEVGVLAGVVMCEALLLKLCLAFEKGLSRAELEKNLLASAVQTITGYPFQDDVGARFPSDLSTGRNISRPNVSTPIALIKWLLVVEEQGIPVFAGETAKQMDLMFKANFFTSRTECLFPVIKHFFNNLDKNIFSLSGEAGADKLDDDIEMADTVDTVSLAAADNLSSVIDGTRKRKEGIDDDTNKTPLKYLRCHIHENTVRENPFTFRQQ